MKTCSFKIVHVIFMSISRNSISETHNVHFFLFFHCHVGQVELPFSVISVS
jgi:hypothetical protein